MSHTPKLACTPANGITLASWEWRAALRGPSPTLLMVHVTGFHGRVKVRPEQSAEGSRTSSYLAGDAVHGRTMRHDLKRP